MMFKRLFLKLDCWLRGHDWHEIQRFNTGGKRVKCLHCSADCAVSNDGRMLPWSPGFDSFYKSIGNRIVKP